VDIKTSGKIITYRLWELPNKGFKTVIAIIPHYKNIQQNIPASAAQILFVMVRMSNK
jgi:hypothetical protein